MAEREPYIGGPTGGVPERIFTPGFHDVVKGASGETSLECSANERTISIMPIERKYANHPVLLVKMALDGNDLHLNLRTKKYGIQHPDLYATKLVKRGIQYLEEQGNKVEKVKGNWVRPLGKESDNFQQYYAFLEEIKKTGDVTEEDMKNAAKHTWTGKLAGSLGYRNVERLRTSRTGAVTVFFGKDR